MHDDIYLLGVLSIAVNSLGTLFRGRGKPGLTGTLRAARNSIFVLGRFYRWCGLHKSLSDRNVVATMSLEIPAFVSDGSTLYATVCLG